MIRLGQKRNSRIGVVDPGLNGMSYAPNFSSPRTIEGHVINCIFKPFVTRLTASLKFLKSSENVVSFIHWSRNFSLKVSHTTSFFCFTRHFIVMCDSYWLISKTSTVASSGECFWAASWTRPPDRNNRKTRHRKMAAISSNRKKMILRLSFVWNTCL